MQLAKTCSRNSYVLQIYEEDQAPFASMLPVRYPNSWVPWCFVHGEHSSCKRKIPDGSALQKEQYFPHMLTLPAPSTLPSPPPHIPLAPGARL